MNQAKEERMELDGTEPQGPSLGPSSHNSMGLQPGKSRSGDQCFCPQLSLRNWILRFKEGTKMSKTGWHHTFTVVSTISCSTMVGGNRHILDAAIFSSFCWRAWQPGASRGARAQTATERCSEAWESQGGEVTSLTPVESPGLCTSFLTRSLLQMGLIFRVRSILEPRLKTFMFSIKSLLASIQASIPTHHLKISPRDKSVAYRY